MRLRVITFIGILTAVVAMIGVGYTASRVLRFPGDRGPVYNTWGAANETFQVRMTAYYEVGIIMPGAFYSAESAPIGSNDWREFLSFRGDDAIPISVIAERFRFVDTHTAYLYTSNQFLLTRDSGRNWSIWEPMLAGVDGKLVYWAIMDARVESDGTGKAKLWRYDEQAKRAAELGITTRDYGQTWNTD